MWSDTRRRKKRRGRHSHRHRHSQKVTIRNFDIDYKQDSLECVRLSGNKPLWTDYLHAGANDEPSYKCPGTNEFPNHRYLHYTDGRYCCTDIPTSPLEACSFLQDQIEPEFANFPERYVGKQRVICQQWRPYCDDILANPEKYQK